MHRMNMISLIVTELCAYEISVVHRPLQVHIFKHFFVIMDTKTDVIKYCVCGNLSLAETIKEISDGKVSILLIFFSSIDIYINTNHYLVQGAVCVHPCVFIVGFIKFYSRYF